MCLNESKLTVIIQIQPSHLLRLVLSASYRLCLVAVPSLRHCSTVAQHRVHDVHESLSPALRLAEHDSELPLLFISFEFIRQLIPVARVGGGYSAGSVAISRPVL